MDKKIFLDEMLEKYDKDVIKNIKKDNFNNIINFLKEKNCDIINEIIEDYLDLFLFDYYDFVNKYNELDKKYNNNLLEEIKDDMSIMEKFYM